MKNPIRTPKGMGFGEGGRRLPDLANLFNATANDLEILYAETSTNDALRRTRGTDEERIFVDGAVTDSGADEIEGATITFTPTGSTSGEAYTTTTDEDGAYVLKVGYAGNYDITAEADGYTPKTLSSQAVSAVLDTHDIADVPFNLAVESTTPETDAEDVAGTDTIVVTFDRNIADNSGEGDIEDGITVEQGGEELSINTAGVSDAELTITLDSAMDTDGKEVTVTIEKADTIKADDDDGLLAEDYTFGFTMLAEANNISLSGDASVTSDNEPADGTYTAELDVALAGVVVKWTTDFLKADIDGLKIGEEELTEDDLDAFVGDGLELTSDEAGEAELTVTFTDDLDKGPADITAGIDDGDELVDSTEADSVAVTVDTTADNG